MFDGELEKWLGVWDKSVKEKLLKEPDPAPPEFHPAVIIDNKKEVAKNPDTKYWGMLYESMKRSQIGKGEKVLKEESRPTKDEIDNVTQSVSASFNPVYPDSYGKDQKMNVPDNWTDGKELRELSDLKVNLERLESKLNSKDGLGESTDKIQKQIDELKTKMDELSDSLAGHRFNNKPS